MTADQFLKNKNTDNQLFFVYGTEELYIEKVKKHISESVTGDGLNIDVFDSSASVDQIINVADQMPFFSDYRLIVINEPGFMKNKDGDILIEYIKSMPATTKILIIMRSEPDKRRLVYKYFNKNAVVIEANAISDSMLEEWVMNIASQKQLNIGKSEVKLIIEMTGKNMLVLENELNKLAMLEKRKITEELIKQVVSSSNEYDVFMLHTYMLKKEYKKAFELAKKIYSDEKTFIPLVALLFVKFEQMLMSKQMLLSGKSQQQAVNEVAAEMKISPYAAKYAVNECRDFEIESLKRSVSLLEEYEYALKSGKKDSGIERFLLEIYTNA